ncbi:hypothetical protein ACFFR3_07405 [Nonomuraea salmonea]|uniref:Uncharacterized protein n=1 Tax=Nonomuraea salmonea TaxID=46181 RepID=A0ABV5NGA6_9ACTN
MMIELDVHVDGARTLHVYDTAQATASGCRSCGAGVGRGVRRR